jgi:hypothetical protein
MMKREDKKVKIKISRALGIVLLTITIIFLSFTLLSLYALFVLFDGCLGGSSSSFLQEAGFLGIVIITLIVASIIGIMYLILSPKKEEEKYG